MEIIKHSSGKYITVYGGRMGYTHDQNKAQKFLNGEAQSYIINQVKKSLRDDLTIIPINNDNMDAATEIVTKVFDKPKQEIKPSPVTNSETVEESLSDYEYIIACNIDEIVNNYSELMLRAKDSKLVLERKLYEIDEEIQDLLHASEFYSLNSCQGYKLYKLIHETRLRRRKIKNLLYRLDLILAATKEDWASGAIKRQVDGSNNRKYAPRALPELFEKLENKEPI